MDAALPPPVAIPTPRDSALRPGVDPRETGLSRAARDFEAAFIAEMLKHTGVGETPDSFGGGIGEQQFASLLQEAQAREMAKAGGIGLAEFIIAALGETSDER